MKLRIMTKRQLAAEEYRFLEEHRSKMELMKLCGRLLGIVRDSRTYIKASKMGILLPDDPPYYDDILARINSVLDRKD